MTQSTSRISILLTATVLILSWSIACAQGGNRFWLRIDDIPGGDQAEGRKDWIECYGWSWGGDRSVPGGARDQQRSQGVTSMNNVTLVKSLDQTTPLLLQAVADGRIFPTVWLDSDTSGHIERFALRNVTVSLVSVSAKEEFQTEEIELRFTKIERGYLQKSEQGGVKPEFVSTVSYDIEKDETLISNKLPVLNDGDRDGIDDVEDLDRDNNGIGDQVENLPVAPSPGRAGITGVVWLDADGNGVRGPLESAALGSRVELYLDGSNRPIQNRAINEQTGGYAFLDLDPGSYKVRFVPPVGFQFGTPSGESVADPSTGFSPTGSIVGGNNVVRSAAILSDENAYSEFTFEDFSRTEKELLLSGEASVIDDAVTELPILQLTPDFPQVTGSSFYNTTVVAATFSTQFQFRMRGGGLQGEGFTFVVRDPADRDLESFLAAGAGGLGYGGMGESFAVEFDTFPSGGTDPTEAHVGILLNGDISHATTSTAATAPLGEINNGAVWNAWIDYDGSEVEVYLSTAQVKPQNPLVSRLVTLPSRRAYVGFTAATFSATQAHEILSWEYEGGQNNTLVIAPSTSQAELNAVIKSPGTIIIEGDSRSDLTMTSLTTVCGDLIIRNNANLQSINLPNLIEVFGNVFIEENAALSVVNVAALREVAGNILISTDATITSDLREVQSENVNIVGVALENFIGKTGFGETKVELVDEATKMELNIPEGAFTVPEIFEVEQLTGAALDGLLTGAVDSEGAVVDVVPVLGFDYSFAGGGINLNKEVEIQFEISLNNLPAAARANVLAAYDAGTLTVFGSRSEETPMEVFAVCDELDFGIWENCARARALDSNGSPVASFVASVLEFTVFARHFSTYGVAVIEEVPISQADLDFAARQVGSSLQVLPFEGAAGVNLPQTSTLVWTSYAVATAADGTQVHPANRIETSTDLQTWTPAGNDEALQFLDSVTNTRSVTLTTPNGGRERYYRVVVGQ